MTDSVVGRREHDEAVWSKRRDLAEPEEHAGCRPAIARLVDDAVRSFQPQATDEQLVRAIDHDDGLLGRRERSRPPQGVFEQRPRLASIPELLRDAARDAGKPTARPGGQDDAPDVVLHVPAGMHLTCQRTRRPSDATCVEPLTRDVESQRDTAARRGISEARRGPQGWRNERGPEAR